MGIVISGWSNEAHKSMPDIEFDSWDAVSPFLCCEVNDLDTVWTLEIWGRFLNEASILLLKTSDDKVLELTPAAHRLYQETDSLTKSPVTGEWIEHWHYKHILEYRLTSTALNYFMAHGIVKMRLGTESQWKEKVWQKDELGKNLSKAYQIILEKLSSPPKKKTIYDDF